MENNKGLCKTCDFDTICVFNRVFPVIFCEEFSISDTEQSKILKNIKIENVYDNETIQNCFCGE